MKNRKTQNKNAENVDVFMFEVEFDIWSKDGQYKFNEVIENDMVIMTNFWLKRNISGKQVWPNMRYCS